MYLELNKTLSPEERHRYTFATIGKAFRWTGGKWIRRTDKFPFRGVIRIGHVSPANKKLHVIILSFCVFHFSDLRHYGHLPTMFMDQLHGLITRRMMMCFMTVTGMLPWLAAFVTTTNIYGASLLMPQCAHLKHYVNVYIGWPYFSSRTNPIILSRLSRTI